VIALVYWLASKASETVSGVYKFVKLYMQIYGCMWSIIVAWACI